MFFPLPKNESARPKRAFPLNQYLPLNDRCFCEHFLIILSFMNVSPWKPFKHVIPPHPGALSRPPHKSPKPECTSWKKPEPRTSYLASYLFSWSLVSAEWFHIKRMSPFLLTRKTTLSFRMPTTLGSVALSHSNPLDHLAQKKQQHQRLFHRKAARLLLRSLARYLELIPISDHQGCLFLSRKVIPSATKNASPPMKQHREFHWICGWHCGDDSSLRMLARDQQDYDYDISSSSSLYYFILTTYQQKNLFEKTKFSQRISQTTNNPVLPFKKTCLKKCLKNLRGGLLEDSFAVGKKDLKGRHCTFSGFWSKSSGSMK